MMPIFNQNKNIIAINYGKYTIEKVYYNSHLVWQRINPGDVVFYERSEGVYEIKIKSGFYLVEMVGDGGYGHYHDNLGMPDTNGGGSGSGFAAKINLFSGIYTASIVFQGNYILLLNNDELITVYSGGDASRSTNGLGGSLPVVSTELEVVEELCNSAGNNGWRVKNSSGNFTAHNGGGSVWEGFGHGGGSSKHLPGKTDWSAGAIRITWLGTNV